MRRIWSISSLVHCAAVAALGLSTVVAAQVVPVGTRPVVGSSNPATAEPPVSRPSTTPCVETLFDNEAFNDYSAHAISHTPVTGCGRGNWAKVVLTIDFTVTAGRQYDRTASLYLGNANIFFGTTAEPRSVSTNNPSGLSPSWHVERDVTDLSALFKTAQTGQAIIYNIFNSTYNGGIYATAKLYFYPPNFRNPPAVVPEAVIPVSGVNSPYELDTTASQLTTAVTAPRNTVKAYLDVIAQSQSSDEFWYLCVPSAVATELETCPGTAFRETEITIDGKPAGIAPVYPWIYTGGIDPYLWEPIVGVQTLNFKPYRVDLTPFAGVLSDGQPHTVGVSVYNASSYFVATANLLLYTDPFRKQTGGGLLESTLSAAPTPQVVQNLVTDSTGTTVGTIDVTSNRRFVVKGYVNTAFGRVETTVEQKVDFDSAQTFKVGTYEIQNTVQTSTVDSKTTSQLGFLKEVTDKRISFPLILDYSYIVNADNSAYQTVIADQKDIEIETKSINGLPIYGNSVKEQVHSTDTLNFNAAGALVSATNSAATANYKSEDTSGNCFSRKVTSAGRAVTAVTDGAGCSTKR